MTLRAAKTGTILHVLLLEKNFWGSGTSGRNSHLIHGGLRYLKYFDFGLVREALRERSRLLQLCPDTVRPLRFEMHLNTWGEALFYGAGIALYDILAAGNRIGSSKYFGKTLSYWDAASDSAALVLDNVADARAHGALCLPYTNAERITADSVELSSGEIISAKVVVDARGPWISSPGLRLVRGSHIVVPRLYEGDHAIAHFHTDGRIIFFIPWGELAPLTLIGTTEADHEGNADHAEISAAERDYLCAIASSLFPGFAKENIVGEFSSLRPLVQETGKSASATSREHKIAYDSSGILKIEGGKYTTYRSMAEESADKVLARLQPQLVGFYPTRNTAFTAPTQRPKEFWERVAWSKERDECRHAKDFLTCCTNWAWQKKWSPEELLALEEVLSS